MADSRIIFWIIALATGIQHVACSSDDVSELHEIEDFLSMCESQLTFDDRYKDVVLVLGNTGAGKSTFTQWVAGDDSQLISTEFVKRSGEFIIIDNNNKIGNSTIQSKTIFPELVVDKTTGTAYYDISGFSDTRGIKHDIVTSYFIKRIIDHVNNIKILLVVNHSAVRKGVDRLDLIRLLRHFTDLVNNTDRYHNGIGLVVTKVDNSYIVEPDESVSLVSDEAVKSSIATFLQDVAEDLEDNAESQTASFEDTTFALKAINLINALLLSNSKPYEKISLFRRPNRLGSISEIPLLQKAKIQAQIMVTQNLQFIPKHTDDFRYTVSDETKNKLHDLLKSLENSLEENVKSVGNDLFNHFNLQLNKIQHIIQHEVDIHDTNMVDLNLMTINNLIELVDEAISEILTLQSSFDNIERPQNVPNIINKTLSNLNLDTSEAILSDILSIANFLDFIQTTSILKFKLNSNPLKQAIHHSARKLEQARIIVKGDHIKLLIDVDNNVKNMIRMSVTELKDKIANHEKDVHDIRELSERMSRFCNETTKVHNNTNPDANLKDLRLGPYKIILTNYILRKIEMEEYHLYLKNEIDMLITYLCDSQKWYEFLNVLYNKLSSYEIQKQKGTTKHCNAFVHGTDKYEGKKVEDTNIDLILRDCYNDLYNAEYNKIKNVNLNNLKLKLLQDVANLTLTTDAFSQNCNGSKLTVKDRFVRLSAINTNICSSLISLEIFGSEKVFIDTNVYFTGQNIQMTVMAPTWEIIGEREISLNGSPGTRIVPQKANDDEEGKPGNPGGNGGDFLGFGDTFIDGENLSIFSNGGDASSGQGGGDGSPGRDAGSYYNQKYERETCNYLFVYCTDHIAEEYDCSNGKDGHLGGVGGKGGTAGVVKIYSNAPFKISAINGKDGATGSVGRPGRGGTPALKQTVSDTNLWLLFGSVTLKSRVNNKYKTCRSGHTPYEPSWRGWRPEAPPKTEYISSTVFNEYNAFLTQNLEKTLRKDVLTKSLLSANQTIHEYFA